MTFGASYWLWALFFPPVLVLLFLANEKRRRALVQKIVAPRLLSRLAGSSSPGRRGLRFGILLLGIAAVIVSLAQPQYGYTWEQSKRKGRDVLIAIDTSKSMLSTDIAPDRLTRAKLASEDLVNQLEGDRAGVLAFAGDAFLQTPLTIDYNAALDSINDLDVNTIPRGGTDIAAVINEAARAFGEGESEDRALVLFTDGEELEQDAVAAARAQAGKFRIFTVGTGTANGSLIPLPDGGFVKDDAGNFVKSKLDESRLKEIATATGGFYIHMQNGASDMKQIVQQGLGKMREHDVDTRMTRHPIERYQWPLGLGLALICASMFISERRRVPSGKRRNVKRRIAAQTALVLLAALAGARTASALPPNQGIELYNDKKYKESYDSFNQQLSRNPNSQALEFDRGAAAYKSGDFDKAIDAFGNATTSSQPAMREAAEYNLGNALCMRGAMQQEKETKLKDWKNALQHYDEALKINSKNADAKYNRDAVAKLIDQLNQPPPQQQQQQKNDQQKNDQKNQSGKGSQQDQKNGQQDQKNNSQQSQQNPGKGENSKQGQQNQQAQSGSNSQNSQANQQQQPQNQGQQAQNSQQPQPQNSGSESQSTSSGSQQPQNAQSQQQPSQSGSQKENANSAQANTAQSPQPSPSPSPSSQQGETGQGQQGQAGSASQTGTQSQGGAESQAYAAGQNREMTPSEAARVVEAEKDEEPKGVLNEHHMSAPVLKDW